MTRQVLVAVGAAEADLAADALWQAGAVAIEERPGALVAGVGEADDPTPLLAAVAGRWPARLVEVDVDAALDAWRAHARAVAVGRRLVVRPPWVDPPTVDRGGLGRVEVVIDPGRAFGHGAHPSTRLVLAALDDLVRGGERVLDVGCGSGVLAIAALALGAATAVAVDIDLAAVAACRANAARNDVDDRLTVLDGAGHVPPAAFDLVVANMLLPDLVAATPLIAGRLAGGGTAVVSGVLAEQRAELVATCDATGLLVRGERAEAGWVALSLAAA